MIKKFLLIKGVGKFANYSPVDKSIKEKSEGVAALREASIIAARGTLDRITMPIFAMKDFEGLLLRTLEDVAADAEKLTRDHISSCMDKQGEEWVGKGLTYVKGDRCPFCGRSLAGLALIHAYKAFFSAAYGALKAEIKEARRKVDDQFSQASLLAAQSVTAANSANVEFWTKYVDIQNPTMSFQELRSVWESLHGVIDEYLRRKEASPLEPLKAGEDMAKAFEAYEDAATKVVKYNEAVDAANTLIGQVKHNATAGNLADAEAELAALQNAKKRHEDPAVINLCESYIKLLDDKQKLDGDKTKAKKKLDQYAQKVLPDYEKSINKHLANFGADFKLCNSATKYSGGKPSADYQLSINDTPVNLGDAKSSPANPCFRNTLSAGDKSTLALAFFIARVEQDPSLSDVIVIFDDPISSFDANRRQHTQHKISELGSKAKQVIVLSHDPHFLFSVWSEEKQSPAKTLQIARRGKESAIEEWNIEEAARDAYMNDYF